MPRTPRSPVSVLLPLPHGLKITSICETPDTLVVAVSSNRRSSTCPLCSTPSRHIHSHYQRKPADLPCAGHPIRLLLEVRRFFCRVTTCRRKVFTERVPQLLEPSSRFTTRLRAALQQVGFSCGGKGSERLADALGMRASDTTILWSLHLVRSSVPPADQVRVVGIDDWSWRKGKSYGTIIVDLQTHTVVDLLPDRSVESVSSWLAAHPQVEVVSRDRGATYVDGATQGAPQAVQVADRWHLYKNLGDAVEAFLARCQVRVPQEISSGDVKSRGDAMRPPLLPPVSISPQSQQQSQARLHRKWKLHQHVHALRSQGLSLHQVAKEVGLARNTVRKYARQSVPAVAPQPTPRPRRASVLDSYEEYLLRRWNEGRHNAALLFREITEQGYRGGKTVVKDYIRYLRMHPAQATLPHPRQQRAASASPRELRWLLARQREDLDVEQQARLQRLLSVSTDVQQVYALLQNFHVMLRHKQHEQLDCWLEQAHKSDINELKSFALGIRRDYNAVKAAIMLPWSQGQTEGQVNKLKTVKREMYGRAGFALLRQRLLQSSSALPR